MKKLIFLLCLLIPFLMEAQTKNLNRFYHHYKKKSDVKNFVVPGWLIGMGVGIGMKHVDNEDERAALKLAKKIRKVRLLISDEQNPVRPADMKELMKRLRGKDGYEDLIFVRSEETRVDVMARIKGSTINNLLVMVGEPESFVMVSLTTKFSIEDINAVLRSIERDIKIDIPELEEPDLPEEPELPSEPLEIRA